METRYFNAVKQPEAGTKLGGSVIRSGGLVAFPTETVYGLGANGLDGEAVNKIFEAKGRPNDNPLILHIAKKSDLKDLWKSVPERARLLMDEFWPGPLTMVYLKSSSVPEEVTGGLDTVAVRMPDNRTALALIRAAGVPIAAPSANLSGKPSPTTADHVKADMNGKIDVIIDGGPCNIGVESTVVSLMGGAVTILRPGGITREMLEAVIGPVNLSPAVLAPRKQGEAAASPSDNGLLRFSAVRPGAQLLHRLVRAGGRQPGHHADGGGGDDVIRRKARHHIQAHRPQDAAQNGAHRGDPPLPAAPGLHGLTRRIGDHRNGRHACDSKIHSSSPPAPVYVRRRWADTGPQKKSSPGRRMVCKWNNSVL